MSKHTAGPWWFHPSGSTGNAVFYVPTSGGTWGYNLPLNMKDETGEANAHLIAAAPELLQMVKLFYEYAGRVCPSQLEKIESLIAKAEGRADG